MQDLTVEFERNAVEAGALVERCAFAPGLVRAAVARIATNARSIIVAGMEIIPAESFSGLRDLAGVILEPTDEQLAKADVGVTEAFGGVASTGSVCIAMGSGLNSAASLLMPLHIVLLPVERIVERPRELFAPERFGGAGLKQDFVFVTGPSATADMGPLVRGVHGPHRLHILLLERPAT